MIVLNDDHNTFEGVAQALARVLPGVSYDGGMAMANTIHHSGRAVVWTGPREPAELYWEQLERAGPHDGPAGAGLASATGCGLGRAAGAHELVERGQQRHLVGADAAARASSAIRSEYQ